MPAWSEIAPVLTRPTSPRCSRSNETRGSPYDHETVLDGANLEDRLGQHGSLTLTSAQAIYGTLAGSRPRNGTARNRNKSNSANASPHHPR